MHSTRSGYYDRPASARLFLCDPRRQCRHSRLFLVGGAPALSMLRSSLTSLWRVKEQAPCRRGKGIPRKENVPALMPKGRLRRWRLVEQQQCLVKLWCGRAKVAQDALGVMFAKRGTLRGSSARGCLMAPAGSRKLPHYPPQVEGARPGIGSEKRKTSVAVADCRNASAGSAYTKEKDHRGGFTESLPQRTPV
jgi:hypothetical protein